MLAREKFIVYVGVCKVKILFTHILNFHLSLTFHASKLRSFEDTLGVLNEARN